MRIIILNKRRSFITILIISVAILFIALSIHFINKSAHVFVDPCNGVIVVDPGHGGIDSGTKSGDVLEKDINLSIALKLKYILEQKGYKVIMTREKDESLDQLSNLNTSRHQKDLNARKNIINESNAQLFLSIHVNYHAKNPNANSAVVFYNEKYSQNKILAYSIQRALNVIETDGIKRTTHDPVKASYYLLNQSNVPGVIIETAFLSNAYDRELLMRDGFREDIARSTAIGIGKYMSDLKINIPQNASSIEY